MNLRRLLASTLVIGLLASSGMAARPVAGSTFSGASATVAAGTVAWTTRWVAVRSAARDTASVEVHLGPRFRLTLTGTTATTSGVRWFQETWRTPGRHGIGWLQASTVTTTRPAGTAYASFDALDRPLAAYLAAYGTRVGVKVVDVTRRVAYTYNAGYAYITASSMKVAIMVTLLDQVAAAHRHLTTTERSRLTAMIERSDNAAASALYREIGGPTGIDAWLRKTGIDGLHPAAFATGWGWSTITPSAMALILQRLHAGRILTAVDRSLALSLMEHVIASQRFGVGDERPAGAVVAMKDGWVIGPDGHWAVNSSGIVALHGETYVISVYTRGNGTFGRGVSIVDHVADVVAEILR